jgi:GT2 family glycosyltransferase
LIHIIIPVHNRLSLTKQCIRSIENQTYSDWKIYVVDDGSSDGTFEWLSSLNNSNIKCIKSDGSNWWTGSMHLGVKDALKNSLKNDYIMSINNDIVLSINAIEALINSIKDNPKGIFSSISISNDEDKKIMSSGAKMISWALNIAKHPFYGREYEDLDNFSKVEVDMLTGRSVLYPISVFDNNNSFDYKRFPQYGGDNEFTNRAHKLGYKLFIDPLSVVYVQRSETGLNPIDRALNFSEKIQSLFTIRSVNNIVIRTRFALLVPPIYARPTYLVISMIKILIQLSISNFLIKFRK